MIYLCDEEINRVFGNSVHVGLYHCTGSFTPVCLQDLLVSLADPEMYETTTDPSCGLGGILRTVTTYVQHNIDEKTSGEGANCAMLDLSENLGGCDVNPRIVNIATLILFPAWITDIGCADFARSEIRAKSDIVICDPPFGAPAPTQSVECRVGDVTINVRKPSTEIAFLLKSLETLNETGRMCLVVRLSSILDSNYLKSVWRPLIEQDLLEGVVELPAGVYRKAPGLRTAIIVVNRKKAEARRNKIVLVKSKEHSQRGAKRHSPFNVDKLVAYFRGTELEKETVAVVSKEELQANGHMVLPSRYLAQAESEIRELVANEQALPLSHLAKIIKGGSRPTGRTGKHTGPYVVGKHLSKGIVESELVFDDDVAICTTDNTRQAIREKAILVLLVGELKPTVFDPVTCAIGSEEGGEPCAEVILSSNIAAIIPNSDVVDFEYLYFQLHSPLVTRQVDGIRTGVAVPHIPLSLFRQLVIPIYSSKQEQRLFVRQQKQLILQRENARHDAFVSALQVTEERKSAEFQIISHLSHNLKPKILTARSFMKPLRSLLSQNGLLGEPLLEPLDEHDEVPTVTEELARAENALIQMTSVLNSARKIVTKEINTADFQDVHMKELIEGNIKPLCNGKNYQIKVLCNADCALFLHRESFLEMINNLVNNAEVHGFSEPAKQYAIEFRIQEHAKQEVVVIDYTNNGNMLPEDLTEEAFTKFGRKGKGSKGEGFGGAWVGKVLEAHKGQFAIVRDGKNPVHFRITIPRKPHGREERQTD